MLYQISGKQIDIGAALQTHVKSVVDAIASKYAERPTDASVIFSRSSNEFVCEVSVHLSTGLTAQAKAHDHEIYAAFDSAAPMNQFTFIQINNIMVTDAEIIIAITICMG